MPQPGLEIEWLPENDSEVKVLLNRPLPPYILPISALWVRMTDEVAEEFDTAMVTAAPLRLRKAFNTASHLTQHRELFNFVLSVLSSIFDEAKVHELNRPLDLAELPLSTWQFPAIE